LGSTCISAHLLDTIPTTTISRFLLDSFSFPTGRFLYYHFVSTTAISFWVFSPRPFSSAFSDPPAPPAVLPYCCVLFYRSPSFLSAFLVGTFVSVWVAVAPSNRYRRFAYTLTTTFSAVLRLSRSPAAFVSCRAAITTTAFLFVTISFPTHRFPAFTADSLSRSFSVRFCFVFSCFPCCVSTTAFSSVSLFLRFVLRFSCTIPLLRFAFLPGGFWVSRPAPFYGTNISFTSDTKFPAFRTVPHVVVSFYSFLYSPGTAIFTLYHLHFVLHSYACTCLTYYSLFLRFLY